MFWSQLRGRRSGLATVLTQNSPDLASFPPEARSTPVDHDPAGLDRVYRGSSRKTPKLDKFCVRTVLNPEPDRSLTAISQP